MQGMKRLASITITGLILSGFSASSFAAEQQKTYVVVLPSKISDQAKAVAALGGTVTQTLSNIDTLIVRMSPNAANQLSLNKGWVVEEDKTFTVSDTQLNPPSWGLDRIDQRNLPLDNSYTYQTTEQGQGVTAYIIDTGIRADHEQFGGRVRTERYQGYTDTSGTGDCHGHGTHVAGTIGGSTVGEAKQVTLTAVAILDCSGSGSTTVIASGVDWAVADHTSGTPAVANMSLGGGASTALDAVVSKMVSDGITVVVAAGNSGADACNYSPARASSAITVGATDSTDTKASWSNYGTCVDLFAPGVSIYSSYKSSSTSYATMSGTSMASPTVAGVVARYLGVNTTATPSQVWSNLQPTLTNGKVVGAGTGSPNLLLFANPSGFQVTSPQDPVVAPAAPTGFATTKVAKSSVGLAWVAPAGTLSGYTLQISTRSDFATRSSFTLSATSLSATISRLTSNTTYYVRISAYNSGGTSPWSSTLTFKTTR